MERDDAREAEERRRGNGRALAEETARRVPREERRERAEERLGREDRLQRAAASRRGSRPRTQT